MNSNSNSVYLDHAAATPVDPRVLAAMVPYFSEQFYNPSAPYAPAVEVRRHYSEAKESIARIIGAHADELIMTAGATESINIALRSVTGHKVCSAIEHDAVLQTIKQGDHTIVAVDASGRVNPDAMKQAITDTTVLVSVGLANHELGTVQPISHIAEVVSVVRRDRAQRGVAVPLYLHCDASQGFGIIDIHVARLGVDLLTLNAAKIYGPKQVGLLWVRPGAIIAGGLTGGGQEGGVRSGTENVAGVIGFSEAARLADKKRKAEVKRLSDLRDTLEASIIEAIPDAVVTGARKHRLANYLHISFPSIDAERLVFLLEMKGVFVATGSACAARKETRSRVLEAIGLDDAVADGSLRITLGRTTDAAAIAVAAREIIAAVSIERDRLARQKGHA